MSSKGCYVKFELKTRRSPFRKSKEEHKDQESIQKSTISGLKTHMGK